MAAKRARRTEAPSDLSVQQARELWVWKQQKYPWMTKAQVRDAVNDCLEYHAARGSLWADWKLVCMRWIRENVKGGKIREPSPLDSRAQEREREAQAERRRNDRTARSELSKLLPMELEALLAEGRKTRGF